MKNSINIIKYDIENYPFFNIVSKWLDIQHLSKLHNVKKYDRFVRKNDQSTDWHKSFYKKIRQDEGFNIIYKEFLRNVIKPRYSEVIVYQKIPTFRVHLPGNVAVGEFHKDKDYRNGEWAAKVRETNYFLPLTKAYNTNTVWTESEEDKADFKPIEANYGDCVEWDASNLTHGNKENTTGESRVSFDFRIIPISRYINSDHNTINTKTSFSIGGYYDII